MKAGRKKQVLTEKEGEIMQLLWANGPMFVRQMIEHYPDPKPHFSTVSTTVRILEEKGYVGHESIGGSHRYMALKEKAEFRSRSLADIICNYFDNSYTAVVSTLIEEDKISAEELRQLIDLVESKNKNKNE